MEIDWPKTLEPWESSEGAKQVTDEREIDVVIRVCEHVGEGSVTIEHSRKDLLVQDALWELLKIGHSKYDLFAKVADHVREHRKVWRTHLKNQKFLTYEFPLEVDGVLKYMKFQVKSKDLIHPNKIKKLWMSFHTSYKKNVEVIYV